MPSSVPQETTAWHTLDVATVKQRLELGSERVGLRHEEAGRRLAQSGPNEIAEGKGRSVFAILLAQFADFMILVLIAAAVISGLIGDVTDTIVVIAIVVLNAVIGFVQEYRAERAIAALKRLAALSARVVRDGKEQAIPAREVVPGDVLLLEAGDAVPADLRLVEAAQLRVEEAALTGESQPVEKLIHALDSADLPLGDRRNMAWKGTLVTHGRARGVVVATGMATELGRIAGLLSGEEEVKTPLQKRLARFGRSLSVVVLVICTVLFVVGLLRGEPLMLMLLTAISLAVAAIPEALPAVVSVSLALGARRMVLRHALIRKLPAVETLGSVTYICSDKTGTLTENRMRAEEIIAAANLQTWPGDEVSAQAEPWQTLFSALALSNDARRDESGKLLGDPTETALLEAAEQAGFVKHELESRHARRAELPFDSERARMTTLHQLGGAIIGYTKGAPESVLPQCKGVLGGEGEMALDHKRVEAEVARMARNGLRVLAVAVRHWPAVPEGMTANHVESELVLVGLVGLIDPPRAEAAEAVALCKSAGITPVMITGDHPETAAAIARRLGILDEGGEVMTGRQLAHLSLREFEEKISHVRVYARVAPEQKIKIVKALQDRGEFVAMTGDGVNDAPALKRADMGVAMGITGTDVAKEAAHMILLDDNFATIVKAVREGRRIFDNIRKFIKYTMTSNSGEIWTIFLAPFLGLPIPLLPIHILWINLVTDGLPGLALAVEPEEKGVMRRPPRPPGESIFAHGMWQHMLWVGLLMGAASLFTQAWAIHTGNGHWQTMVFTVLTLSQLGHVMAIRSEHEALLTQGVFSNRPLIVAVLFTVALQMAVIYVPWLNPIFKTEPLAWDELAFCLAMSSIVFLAVEAEKWLRRRGWIYRDA
jgi:Ca2+-transporting ATPase